MLRPFALLAAAAVLTAAAAPAAPVAPPDTYVIKLKKEAEGDRVRVTKTDDGTTAFTFEIMNQTVSKEDKKASRRVYTDEIVKKPAGAKQADKVRRTYEAAEQLAGGKKKNLPYAKAVVLIEKDGDKYTFTVEGGAELTGADAAELDKEFNKPTDTAVDNEDFLPGKPVRLNEAWPVDVNKLARSLAGENGIKLDAAKSKATGKLTKVYDKAGKRFGVMEFTIAFVMTSLEAAGNTIPLQDGSRMDITMTLDVCIDGTSHDGVERAAMSTDLTGDLPNGTVTVGGKAKLGETHEEKGK